MNESTLKEDKCARGKLSGYKSPKLGLFKQIIVDDNKIHIGILNKNKANSNYLNFGTWMLINEDIEVEGVQKWINLTLRKINLQVKGSKIHYFVCEFPKYDELCLRKRLYKTRFFLNIEFTFFYDKNITLDEILPQMQEIASNFYREIKNQELFTTYTRRK